MVDTSLTGASNRPGPREVWGWLARGEVGLAIGIVGIIVLLILPIPPFMLELLLTISIGSSILILMTALLIKKPLEFTAFPTVLLVTTLYRLGLNLASTRLILSHGHTVRAVGMRYPVQHTQGLHQHQSGQQDKHKAMQAALHISHGAPCLQRSAQTFALWGPPQKRNSLGGGCCRNSLGGRPRRLNSCSVTSTRSPQA